LPDSTRARFFVEGHCLDEATSARVPADMIGRRLTAKRAGALIEALDGKARKQIDNAPRRLPLSARERPQLL
jgi:hypothetical protein